MKIISKVYKKDLEVLFSLDETIYINATKVAKQFGKKPETFLKTGQIKDYIEALKSATGIEKIAIIQKGGKPDEQGTWIHKKLIIAFARWLSPDFAVWCDLQIEEILKSQNLQSNQPVQTKTSQTFDIKSYTQQNRELIELIELINSKSAITLHYLDKLTKQLNLKSPLELLQIDLNSYYFIPTELGKFLNKSAVEVNKILEHKGFQVKVDGVWQLTKKGEKYAIQLDNNYKTIKWKLESLV
jgi:hypothetical protein